MIRTSRRARKSSAGYDLTRLFVGSEGTLGVITEVTVRLYGIPAAMSSATCSFASASFLWAGILGHAGEGNFHVDFNLLPNDPKELAEAKRLNERLVYRALAFDGTCTGEHGIGCGKIEFLLAEHGEAVSVMRAIKRAIDPDNIMNPGKILEV